jgi:hypothetical protein
MYSTVPKSSVLQASCCCCFSDCWVNQCPPETRKIVQITAGGRYIRKSPKLTPLLPPFCLQHTTGKRHILIKNPLFDQDHSTIRLAERPKDERKQSKGPRIQARMTSSRHTMQRLPPPSIPHQGKKGLGAQSLAPEFRHSTLGNPSGKLERLLPSNSLGPISDLCQGKAENPQAAYSSYI